MDFISKDVRSYMEENNMQFNDWDMAALIYHFGFPVKEMLSRLEELMRSTDDETLRQQISERLAIEREKLTAFHERTRGYVYAVRSYEYENEPDICGYFANAELAYAHGMKQQCKFEIEKSRIIGFDGMKPKTSKGYMNPYIFSDLGMDELVDECEGGGTEAELTFDQKGVLTFYWSSEIERSDEEELELIYSPQRFENKFPFFMPNPFDIGDIVRDITTGKHGVVELSQEEWKNFLARVEAGLYSDFSDASITVEIVYESGYISHSHINPVFLERYEPGKEDDDFDLLTASSWLITGECSLDWFRHCYDAYKEKCQKAKEKEK